VGLGGLLERRPERRDQIVRQLLDEADGVRDQNRRVGLRGQQAHRGVERSEQLLGDVDLATGPGGRQRRLTRGSVAVQRPPRQLAAAAAADLGVALDLGQLVAQLGDAIADAAAIELERALAGALATDATADAVLAAARLAQARRQVLEARDLDLQPRLAGL